MGRSWPAGHSYTNTHVHRHSSITITHEWKDEQNQKMSVKLSLQSLKVLSFKIQTLKSPQSVFNTRLKNRSSSIWPQSSVRVDMFLKKRRAVVVQVQLSAALTIVTQGWPPLHGHAIDNPNPCSLAFRKNSISPRRLLTGGDAAPRIWHLNMALVRLNVWGRFGRTVAAGDQSSLTFFHSVNPVELHLRGFHFCPLTNIYLMNIR